MRKTLLQLLIDNRRPAALSRVVAAAKADEPTTVYLYDPIVGDRWMAEYFGGVCAQDFVPQLEAIEGDVTLRINCPGGDVFAMKAIMAAIRNMKGKVTAVIDGICASAATNIACACDEVVMEPGTNYMIHNAQSFAMGDRNDLRKMADLMEQIDGQIVDTYVEKTGKTRAAVTDWMDAETWFTAEQAVENGFADRLAESEKKVKALGGWKLDAFANAPKVEAKEPVPPPEPTPTPAPSPAPAPAAISDEHRDRQRQRLKVAALLDPQFTAPSRK